jgi:hypothetical protein
MKFGHWNPIDAARPHRIAFIVGLVLAMVAQATLAASTGSVPPTLRVHMVNDVDAKSLAAVRRDLASEVETCRAMLNMPPAPPPQLSDAQLSKIVFYDEVDLYTPKAHASYVIKRGLHADDQSKCEPFVWVERSASVFNDCDGFIGGHGVILPSLLLPGVASQLPPPGVGIQPRSAGCSVPAPVPWNLSKLTPTDAGNGVPCVWLTGVVKDAPGGSLWASTWIKHGTAPSDGKNPAPTGDACVYTKQPFYTSSRFMNPPVVLKMFDPHTGDLFDRESRKDIGAEFLYANAHLAEFQEGGPVSEAQFTEGAVSQFVKQSYREGLPAR